MRRNKRGWIRVLEAFIALAFILGIITAVNINSKEIVENKFSSIISDAENNLLISIEKNDSLRAEILSVGEIPVESGESGFPDGSYNLLLEKTPQNMECKLKICSPTTICSLSNPPEKKEIYVENAIIFSSQEEYNPLKLSIFCWKK